MNSLPIMGYPTLANLVRAGSVEQPKLHSGILVHKLVFAGVQIKCQPAL